MIAYIDTSFLLKLYVREADSAAAERLWREADRVFVSRVAYAEVVCAFRRKQREGGLRSEQCGRAWTAFRRDWRRVDVVEVSDELNEAIDRVSARGPLRALDAIHLASALACAARSRTPFVFASADRRLRDAARAETLAVFPGT